MATDPCLTQSESIKLSLTGISPSPRALKADLDLSARTDQGVKVITGDGVWVPDFKLTTAASMPATPIDGQRVMLYRSDDVPDAYHWPLQYYSALNAWLPIGAVPYHDFRGGTGTESGLSGASTWVDLSSSDVAGPSFTIPVNGDYEVGIGGNIAAPANGNTARMGISINGATPTTPNRIGNGNVNNAEISGVRKLVGLSAGDTLACLYNADGTTGTPSFARRYMTVVPVKLTP